MIVTGISRNEKSNEPIRLAAYCRVSTNSEDQKHSFLAQVMYYKDYEKEHPDCKLVDVYADEGITGTSMEKREDFKRMIDDCRRGKIDRIIVKSVSRFARNNEECLTVLRELKDLGISVFFEKENLSTDAMSSEFIVSLFGMNAQQESRSISDNVRWSYQHRMQSGEFNTCKPALGYEIVNGNLVIIEEEAETVRRIFNMFLAGIAKERIAQILTEEGVPTKTGKTKWYASTVCYILTNERYMGDALLQKRYTTDTLPFKKKHNHGEKEQYYVENSNVPIVSKEIFQAVRDLMSIRKTGGFCQNEDENPFKGMLRCSTCGKVMRRISNVQEPKWVCRTYSRNSKECSVHRINEKELTKAFIILSNKLKDNRKEIIDNTISLMEKAINIAGTNTERIHDIDLEIADLSKRKYKIAQLYEKRILNDRDFILKNREYDSKLTKIREERRRLFEEDKHAGGIDDLRDLSRAFEKYEKKDTFDTDLFDDIVEYIEVHENGILVFHILGGLALKERGTI